MEKIFILGNPNTGKSTLFNSLTKSHEHTGNYHGVTVDSKCKKVKFKQNEYEIYDLPGLYSLNTFSMEEEISKQAIQNNSSSNILYLVNAFNFKRNMYLCLQLLKRGYQMKVLINQYDEFVRLGGKIDIYKLSNILGCECIISNAKTQKLSSSLLKFKNVEKNIEQKQSLYKDNDKTYFYQNNNETNQQYDVKMDKTKLEFNFYERLKNCSKVEEYYALIDEILAEVYTFNKVAKKSKFDSLLLNIKFVLPLFVVAMFLALYLIFFLIGPRLAESLSAIINIFIASPIKALILKLFGGGFIYVFVEEGLINSALTMCSFVPQVGLLYLFLTLLEESGIISRLSFILDDFLNKIGLNGKCVYTMLMGFGCNTSACFTCKNMSDKNSKIKTSLITPFMSCGAKLPIYTVVATAIVGVNNFWLIFLLYLLGIVSAVAISYLLEKTILKSKNDNFIMEFPPLQKPDMKKVLTTSLNSSKQFVSKIFSIIICFSVILWLLNNLNFKFLFVSDYKQSMLYHISNFISPIFKPLGLNSPTIVASLIVGLIAKEMIVSSMLMFNGVNSVQMLTLSLVLPSSAMCFNLASALSFLTFVLLYAPCLSTIAVMLKEIGGKWTTFALVLQFAWAYLFSMFVYAIFSKSLILLLIGLIVLIGLIFAFKLFAKKLGRLPRMSICSTCCEKKSCLTNCN